MKKSRNYRQSCSLACALDVIGERWTLLIIRDLLSGPRRYKDLVDGLPGAGTNLISQRLKNLCAQGLVNKRVIDFDVQIYELTEIGNGLEEAVITLAKWGVQLKASHLSSWNPWWNPIAIQARYDGRFDKHTNGTGHINIRNVTTEIRIIKGKIKSHNKISCAPDFTISESVQKKNKSHPTRGQLLISGNKELANKFLDSIGWF